MIDMLQIDGLLDEGACAAMRAQLRTAAGAAAGLLGAEEARPLVRKTTRLKIPPALCSRITTLLMAQKERLERHFAQNLATCEEPQFLRYEVGDFFVPHQDGNTPLIHDDSRFRKISLVLFLSRQSEEPAPDTYGGGDLVLHGPYPGPEIRLAPPPGTLVAFRAETTHEVIPVTHGERFTAVTWFR